MEGEILKQREYIVVKGNELIQKNRFELALPEQKTIAYICSMIMPISPGDRVNGVPFQLEYIFNIREYCKICGIDYDNGKNYKLVKETLQKLSDRSMWLDDGNGEVLVRWLAKVRMNKKSGKVIVRIDEDLAPYLFDLKERFTQYQLYNILAMKSAFSVRIYELMKSYQYQNGKTFAIDELKHILMVENVKSYSNFKDVRKNVLEKAITEINELTDINVSYETVLKGRKVEKVVFHVKHKSSVERAMAGARINNRLERKQ